MELASNLETSAAGPEETPESVRQRVLDQKNHEVDWAETGKLQLVVRKLETTSTTEKKESQEELIPQQELEPEPASTFQESVNESEAFVPALSADGNSARVEQEPKPDPSGKFGGETTPSKEFTVVITTATEEDIEDDLLEMYFENKKRSGGGPIKSCVRDHQQIFITFEKEEDARDILQRKNHSVKKIALCVKPLQVEDIQEVLSSSLVVLENVRETTKECVLTLLVENISGLSVDDDDFSMELIPELNAAVITFIKNIDIEKFVQTFNENHRAKQQGLKAGHLEETNIIKIENLPPNISSDYISVYFENKKNGGAQVSDVQQLPEDNAVLVTFHDSKDVNTVLRKQHSLNQVPISVYPYHSSLGTALYGKEGPQIKKPEPIKMPLNPHIWKLLQEDQKLIQKINHDMADCNCDITWPPPSCGNPQIVLSFSNALSSHKRSMAQAIKTWNKDVSAKFSSSISEYKTTKYKINSEVWEAIRNSVKRDQVLIIPEISKEMVVLVGGKEFMKDAEQEMNLLIEKATKKIDREKNVTEEKVSIAPGEYAVLNTSRLDDVYKEYPSMKITYDPSSKKLSLFGVAEDVYKIKSEILEKVHSLEKKAISMHPYIYQFLQHVDNEVVSQSLFVSNQISAFYELGDEVLMLIGASPEVLQKAEEVMVRDLTYKCIELEDQSVLRKREWRDLTNRLYKAHNCLKESITIDEMEDRIVIAGYFRVVGEAYQQLHDFLDRNTQVQKIIKAKSVAVVMFLKERKSSVCLELEKKHVKIEFGTQTSRKSISLSGSKVEVLKAVTMLERILSTLHSKNVLIDKPGARQFFKDSESLYSSGVEQKFRCLIRLQEEGEECEKDDAVSNVHKKSSGICWTKALQNGVLVEVYRGDLCSHPVDVIVNASNEDLKHLGGLAGALLEAAGPELQAECDRFVREHGCLQPGCAVITKPGKLPCKQVVHAVGPRWKQNEAELCVELLKKAVEKSLKLAETYNHRSIALPAISSGLFGFPLKLCALSIATSIKETLEDSTGDSCLKEIHLVDTDEKTVKALIDALEEVSGEKSSSSCSSAWSAADSQPSKARNTKDGEALQMVTTAEGLNIRLLKGGLEDATTDVIVSSVSKDLMLDKGPLSKVLLSKAGPMLQTDLNGEAQGKVASGGSVFQTKGHNLGCSFVLHAIIPAWDKGQGSAQKILGDIIEKCLQIVEEQSLKSIAFPAVGTGNLGFPKTAVAKLMFEQVFQFSSKVNLKSLQEVHFLIHPKDTDNFQAFSNELETCTSGNTASPKGHKSVPRSGKEQPVFFGTILTSTKGRYEMQIGSIKFQVGQGDITKEETDVIVNVSNKSFSLKAGVSKAILKGAGSEVETECAQLASQPHNNFITTQGGNLKCKKIIHLVPSDDIKAQVSKVLQECEERGYKSVAFPAIGTGQAGHDPAKVADAMMDAVVDFANGKSVQSVEKIKIIIFQPHLMDMFHASMQKRQVTEQVHPTPAPRSFFSRVAAYFGFGKRPTEKSPSVVSKTKMMPAIFQICGESWKNVEAAESWIKNQILKQQLEKTISEEGISGFGEREFEKLKDLQKKLYIDIDWDLKEAVPAIRVSGVNQDVLNACLEIQELIKKVREAQEEESKAELVSSLVEWQYLENGSYVPFDSLTNLHLEDAAVGKQKEIDITFENKRYKVDLVAKSALDDQGKRKPIIRIWKMEENQSIVLPATWEDMNQERVKVVQLKPEMKEYEDVQKRFQETCASFKIEKIERIQNPYYWKAYQIKKEEMNTKNGNTNNERLLFHGTTSNSLTAINFKGFNRSYAGMNAANFGNGTYFAVHASYSAHDTYSKPDANGKKYMYLAQVLVGAYCNGRKGDITPPAKNPTDPTDLYDSLTDNVNQPSMFIIFNDIQAYPEYLITFTR
ncbi:PREDICTED: poly [ADP-ribose] polymerase 14-like isoform X2 [Gavialis gangeticus]|uniref:poly [ADP-ribose] polymerase 14-like isoform X2 n=1 Tax=Gavialis gangeticus TaxID=94835 RepID=UPI00092F4337|nr:PREDICTED: poly [ADP-ribose] polymerase 14-like isoform X2 [Gavialis gangeticus]